MICCLSFSMCPDGWPGCCVLRVMRNGIQGKPDGRLISRPGFNVIDLSCCCSPARRFQIQHLYCQLSMVIYAVRWPFGLSVSEMKNVNTSSDATHTPMQWLEYCVLASSRWGGRSCPIGCHRLREQITRVEACRLSHGVQSSFFGWMTVSPIAVLCRWHDCSGSDIIADT